MRLEYSSVSQCNMDGRAGGRQPSGIMLNFEQSIKGSNGPGSWPEKVMLLVVI